MPEQLVPRTIFQGVDVSIASLPREVDAIRRSLAEAMRTPDPRSDGQAVGKSLGIYAFFDYDGEPIYVGQTAENFSARIGRHLTGMRSDSVGKYVLDPFEVYAVAMWSLPHVRGLARAERKKELDKYEFAVHDRLTKQSSFGAVLNEGSIPHFEMAVDLSPPLVQVIIPNEIFPDRSHPDVRIARRALTISLLAKNISERKVSRGLRVALHVQTKRLQDLAGRRVDALAGVPDDPEADALGDDDA